MSVESGFTFGLNISQKVLWAIVVLASAYIAGKLIDLIQTAILRQGVK